MIPLKKLEKVAAAEIHALVKTLPAEVRPHAEALPVFFHDMPTPDLVGDENADDVLGLFVGDSLAEQGLSGAGQPASILLFLGALWDYVEGDWDAFREEVRITYLHELGHFLGWEEDDLTARGLE